MKFSNLEFAKVVIYALFFLAESVIFSPVLAQVKPIPPPPPLLIEKEEEVFIYSSLYTPRFPGCENEYSDDAAKEICAENKLISFYKRNVKYPTKAVDAAVIGEVVVSFIIEKDGSVTNAKIEKDIGYGFGEEVWRVTNLMERQGLKWIPGPARGRAMRFLKKVEFEFTEEMLKKAIESNLKNK